MTRAQILCAILATSVVSVAPAQRIKSGLAFLKLGAGADAIGRGDAMVTNPAPAQALFYNPSALGDASRASVMLMHNESIIDIRNDVLGVNVPLGDWALGFGMQATTVAGIEVRDNASTAPLGTFTSVEGAVTFGAAYAASPEWSLGAAVKILVDKIYINDAAGIAGDIGARYRPANTPWSFGLVLQNIGSMSNLGNESITLPTMMRGAASYDGAFDPDKELRYAVEVGGDKTFADEGFHARFGGQISYDNTLFARAGYKSGYESGAVTAGLGFRYKFLELDYALQPYAQSYGMGHAFSLSIGL